MKLRVHVNYRGPGAQHPSKVGEVVVQCGEGMQVLRWLAYTACTRLAYLKGEPAASYVPQAVTYPDGTVLDVDTVMSELFRDDDDVFVEYSNGPTAFTQRWDGRPVTPPFKWDGKRVVGIPDDEWLRKFDLKAMGFGETLIAQAADHSMQIVPTAMEVEEDLAAAKQQLIDYAGFFQALFVHYASQTLETTGAQGEKDFYVPKGIEEMGSVPYMRMMKDAMLSTSEVPLFAKLERDSGPDIIFHLSKTLEAAKKTSVKKSPMIVLAPPPAGHPNDPKATINFKEFLLAILLLAQYRMAIGKEHMGSVKLSEKLERLVANFFGPNNGLELTNKYTARFTELNVIKGPLVEAIFATQRRHVQRCMDIAMYKRAHAEVRQLDLKSLMLHLRKWGVVNEADISHHDLLKSPLVDVAILGESFQYATHPTEPAVESWQLRKVPLVVTYEEFERLMLVSTYRLYHKYKDTSIPVDASFDQFLLRMLEGMFLRAGVITQGTYIAVGIPTPPPEPEEPEIIPVAETTAAVADDES